MVFCDGVPRGGVRSRSFEKKISRGSIVAVGSPPPQKNEPNSLAATPIKPPDVDAGKPRNGVI